MLFTNYVVLCMTFSCGVKVWVVTSTRRTAIFDDFQTPFRLGKYTFLAARGCPGIYDGPEGLLCTLERPLYFINRIEDTIYFHKPDVRRCNLLLPTDTCTIKSPNTNILFLTVEHIIFSKQNKSPIDLD